MQEKYYADHRLRDLLVRFVEEEKLTAEVVLQTGNYLFERNQCIPFFKDEELFETVVYLRDLMELNNLCNIDDILCYYQQKKQRLRRFVQNSVRSPRTGFDHSIVMAASITPRLYYGVSRRAEIIAFAAAYAVIMLCYAVAISYERCPEDHDDGGQARGYDGFYEIHDCCRRLVPSQDLVTC